MSPCHFMAMMEGYKWRQERDGLEEKYLLRLIASFTHNALVDSKSKAKRPEDFLSIPSIDKTSTKESAQQQKQKLRKALEEANGGNNRRSTD